LVFFLVCWYFSSARPASPYTFWGAGQPAAFAVLAVEVAGRVFAGLAVGWRAAGHHPDTAVGGSAAVVCVLSGLAALAAGAVGGCALSLGRAKSSFSGFLIFLVSGFFPLSCNVFSWLSDATCGCVVVWVAFRVMQAWLRKKRRCSEGLRTYIYINNTSSLATNIRRSCEVLFSFPVSTRSDLASLDGF